MSEDFTELNCKEFVEMLASDAPVPGGGGGAGFAGALGSALCSMAGNFTKGRKKYQAVEADMDRIIARCGRLSCQFLGLVNDDARNFEPLARAYSISKDDPDYPTIMKAATLTACKAPIAVLETCAETVPLIEEMLKKGNTMMLSDVGCAASLIRSACEASYLNVVVNTRTLGDDESGQILERRAYTLKTDLIARAEAVYESVEQRLELR